MSIFKTIFGCSFSQISVFLRFSRTSVYYVFWTILFALFYRVIPRKFGDLRHFYNGIIGIVGCWFIFKFQFLLVVSTSIFGYFLIIIFKKSCNKVVFISLLIMNISLFVLYSWFGWTLYVSSCQWVLIFRIISLAFNVSDGYKLKENPNEKVKKDYHPDYVKRSISKLPTPMEYFGYCFNFCYVLYGPLVDFKFYRESVSSNKSKKAPPPFDLATFGVRLLSALFSLWAFIRFFQWGLVEVNFTADMSYWYSILYLVITMFSNRLKLYFLYYLAESVLILSGCGFSGKDKKSGVYTWEHVRTSHFLRGIVSLGVRNASLHWNISMMKWVRLYVYTRAPAKSRGAKLFGALLVSGLHNIKGKSFGTVITYVQWWFLIQIDYNIFKKVVPRLSKRIRESKILRIIVIILTRVLYSVLLLSVWTTLDQVKLFNTNTMYTFQISIAISYFIVRFCVPAIKKPGKQRDIVK